MRGHALISSTNFHQFNVLLQNDTNEDKPEYSFCNVNERGKSMQLCDFHPTMPTVVSQIENVQHIQQLLVKNFNVDEYRTNKD